jgi:inorganic pyrophosphatase
MLFIVYSIENFKRTILFIQTFSCCMANINIKPTKITPNLLHILPAFANEEKTIVNALIEINAGSINKYELVTETGHLKLDRVNYSSLGYTTAYGAIPMTWDHDGDLLDILIANVTEPLIPGSLVEARIIGIMKFNDGGETDDKVLAVINDDKRQDGIKTYQDLGEHFVKETTYYFEHYKDLKKPGTCKVEGFFDSAEAVKIIEDCIKRYNTDYKSKLD